MMQCASCETKITDHAAETGICPKCGMPLPGIGGTMRFSPSIFANLPEFDAGTMAAIPDFPVENVAARTIGPVEVEVPPSLETLGPRSGTVEAPAHPTTVLPAELPVPADTCVPEPQDENGEAHDTQHEQQQGDAEADINKTIDSRKLSPDEARQYESSLLFGTDPNAGSAIGNAQGSGTQPVPELGSSAQEREHGDTSLFGPETRLLIQSRRLAVPGELTQGQTPGQKSPVRHDYELVEVIGRGGMGLVYAARQTSVDREVAIKMIWPDHALDPSTRENFLSEAVITGELDHPNIVPIHDVGKDAGDKLFYSMKRVRGTPWEKAISKLSLNENLRILMGVADAVAFAHSRGVVHRDLKPENVMLGDFGEVMVMDWGLALVTPEFSKLDSVSRTIGAGCTPSYAAPELVTGPIGAIGTHSDVYLLGAILYKIVTGRPPHLARTPQDCCRVAARNQIHPTDQTGELVEIARKALATKPQDRYASVQEFQEAIRSYQSHSESVVLSDRAAEDLAKSRQTGDYQDFARAMFGYQQAIELWEGNDAARAGLSQARRAYAENALSKEDYDLGLTLVDAKDPAQKPIAERLLAGQTERNHRRRRLKLMYRTAIALVAVIFIGGSIGMYAINQQKEEAQAKKKEADEQRAAAVLAQGKERDAKNEAVREQERAAEAEKDAVAAKDEAVKSEQRAKEQRKTALREKRKADRARRAAVRSQEAQAFEAYVAQIGLASEQINSNAFDSAMAVLDDQESSPYRGWEWHRLDYLARQGQTASRTFESEVEALALDSTGARYVAGFRDGRVLVGRLADLADPVNAKPVELEQGEPVLSVAFSADDRFVAAAGERGTLSVFSAAGQRVGPNWTGHAPDKSIHRVKIVTTDEGRRWLLTASADRTAGIWDISGDSSKWKAEPDQLLAGHHLQVWDAAMSRSGKRLVTAGEDGRVVVWEASAAGGRFAPALSAPDANGKQRQRVFRGHEGAVYAVAFSPDGKLVASAGLDKRVLLWDPERVVEQDLKAQFGADPDPLRGKRGSSDAIALDGHTEPVHAIAFSPDGRYIVSGSDDNTVRIWPKGGDATVLRGHGGWVRACVFSPRPTETGDWNVVSGSHDRQIKLWNVAGYAEVRVLRVERLADHGDAVLGAAFNPRGDQIVTASRDHAARVWRLSKGNEAPVVFEPAPRKLFEGHDFSVTVAAYLRDGRRVVTSGIDGQVCLWDSETGAQLARLPGTGLAAAVAVSPDDVWALTGSSDASVKLWKVDLAIADYAAGRVTAPVHRFEGHEFAVHALAIAPDGSRFYSGDDRGAGRLWDLRARRAISEPLPHHAQRVNAALFTPDGARLVTAADDGKVCICDATSGKLLKTLDHSADAESVNALGLTPDGRRAITVGEPASAGQPFFLFDWDLASGRLNHKSELESGLTVFGLALSPLENNPTALLAIGMRSTGKTELRGWNLASWQEERASDGRRLLDDAVLAAEHATVWSAAWAPSGKRVLTVGGSEAQEWQLDGRTLTMRLGPHRAVASANFSSDGRFVVTGSWDESFKIWDVEGNSAKSLHRVPVPDGGAVNSAVFSPAQGSFQILTAHDDGTVRLWDWDPQTPDARPKQVAGLAHPQSTSSAVFSRDGLRILTLCADGVARVWSVANPKQAELELKGAHAGPVLCGAFSPDGRFIATGGEDKQVVIWNAQDGSTYLEAPLQGHSAAINSLAFSNSGDRLVTGSRDNTAKLWDPRTMLKEPKGPESDADLSSDTPSDAAESGGPSPRSLAVSPPASESASPAGQAGAKDSAGSAEPDDESAADPDLDVERARRVEKLRGKELLTLRGHSSEVTAVAFSPDDRYVLTAGRDNSAILWLTNKP